MYCNPFNPNMGDKYVINVSKYTKLVIGKEEFLFLK